MEFLPFFFWQLWKLTEWHEQNRTGWNQLDKVFYLQHQTISNFHLVLSRAKELRAQKLACIKERYNTWPFQLSNMRMYKGQHYFHER